MITITNLTKKFSSNTVINNLSLEIKDGEITALVGANGAGKSTLIRIIAGLYKQTSGSVTISPIGRIGILLGSDVNLYKNLTGYEIIEYFGKLYGLNSKTILEKVNDLDNILHVSDFLNKQSYTFSRGMKQKIALILSIIHNPDILLLDEPSTGLDLEATNDVINLIKYLKTQGKTIIIATHNIFEISDLSDSIAFINNGKITEKVITKDYFSKCPPNEKSSKLISAMKGGLWNGRSANNPKKRTYGNVSR